eukprot:CAMPEP_0206226064 /NCGR_PEP_ID=MMETSP0047_2-20121206/7874_1 /ASSEMBLY_ACC=CAM_ASM_000192 /TAXON_ID=195065 /ORGANISM="Chroomonas mesostigmatica_cf, Strain CCMP1168" /LENGTH=86 /DNA_ID=CAMNT_0053649091 /DNA_START=26 /DNA_END=283 /DNA_ORIENTATION=+
MGEEVEVCEDDGKKKVPQAAAELEQQPWRFFRAAGIYPEPPPRTLARLYRLIYMVLGACGLFWGALSLLFYIEAKYPILGALIILG